MLLFSLFLLSFVCLPSTDFLLLDFLLCTYALFQILLLFRGEIRCPGSGLSLSCASMSTHLFPSLADLCNAFGLPFTLPFWHSPRTASCGLTLFPFPYASFLFVFAFLRLTSKHRLCEAEHCFTFLPFLCSFGTAFCCLIYPCSHISDSDALCDRARGARCLASFPLCYRIPFDTPVFSSFTDRRRL